MLSFPDHATRRSRVLFLLSTVTVYPSVIASLWIQKDDSGAGWVFGALVAGLICGIAALASMVVDARRSRR
jgi:hypothetical protein